MDHGKGERSSVHPSVRIPGGLIFVGKARGVDLKIAVKPLGTDEYRLQTAAWRD